MLEKLNKWDYAGGCAPDRGDGTGTLGYKTFTLGIFKWIEKSSGKGLKKSAAVIRIVGKNSYPEPAYKKADQICNELNSGKKVSEFKKRINA